MIRNMICASVFVALAAGLVAAEEFGAVITRVEGNKVTLTKMKKGEKGTRPEKGEEVTLTAAKDVPVFNAKFNFKEKKSEKGDALEGGLKNERFTTIGERGVFSSITTDDDGKITEIRVFQPRKKKSDN